MGLLAMEKFEREIIIRKATEKFNIEKSIEGTEAYYINEDIIKGVDESEILLKARAGVYKNTAENRKLGRVGQRFGSKKEEDDSMKLEGNGSLVGDKHPLGAVYGNLAYEEQGKGKYGGALGVDIWGGTSISLRLTSSTKGKPAGGTVHDSAKVEGVNEGNYQEKFKELREQAFNKFGFGDKSKSIFNQLTDNFAKYKGWGSKPEAVKPVTTPTPKVEAKPTPAPAPKTTPKPEPKKEVKPKEDADSGVKAKVNALLNKIPPSNKAVRFKGVSVDHSEKIVTVRAEADRAARHPDEYGGEYGHGGEMESIMYEWDNEFWNKVGDPLEKLGYKIEMHA